MSESTNHSFDKANAWYPRHESDRADELIAQLDAAQVAQLYGVLETKDWFEWLQWMEGDGRAAILRYDALSDKERTKRLNRRATVSDHNYSETLQCHLACIVLELGRVRCADAYFHFPPHGAPVENARDQREAVFAGWTAMHEVTVDVRVMWPFDYPEGKQQNPFRWE